MEGWQGKALCNEVLYSNELNFASSEIWWLEVGQQDFPKIKKLTKSILSWTVDPIKPYYLNTFDFIFLLQLTLISVHVHLFV